MFTYSKLLHKPLCPSATEGMSDILSISNLSEPYVRAKETRNEAVVEGM